MPTKDHEKRLEIQRRYREKNREKLKQQSKEYRSKNAKACLERTKKWQAENPDKVRDYVYKKKYGISLTEYQSLFEQQQGRCKICNRDEKLVIDHCHNSSSIRGLLCDRCNVGLGCFGDSADRLLSAISYLNENSKGLPCQR